MEKLSHFAILATKSLFEAGHNPCLGIIADSSLSSSTRTHAETAREPLTAERSAKGLKREEIKLQKMLWYEGGNPT